MADIDQYTSLIIDNQEIICIISDPETHEILYMSNPCLKLLGLKDENDYLGKKCYELLYNYTCECATCPIKNLTPNSCCRRECHDHIFGQRVYITDTLVSSSGKTMKMEIFRRFSERKSELAVLKERLTIEETLVRCIRTLSLEENTSLAINSLLEIVGDFFQASRAYIYEFDSINRNMTSTYEWTSEKSNPNNHHIPFDEYYFNHSHLFKSCENALKHQLEHGCNEVECLNLDGDNSLIACALVENDQVIGVIGVENSQVNRDTPELLSSVAYFVINDLSKRHMLLKLQKMSFRDMLTGVYNRNKYINVIQEYEDNPPDSLGIAYIDANSMKDINDTYGHKYGDRMLIRTANLLRQYFDSFVFRIGGDEFVALSININEQDFNQKIDNLRHSSKIGNYDISIGSVWKSGKFSLLDEISRADELMYKEKKSSKAIHK